MFLQVRVNPRLSHRELTNTFSKNREIRLPSNTVRSILLRKNIGVYAAVRKPMLTVREWLTRLKWCKQRIRWSLEKWKQVSFSDKSNFEVTNGKSKVLVKRFKSEKYSNRFIVLRLQGGSGSVGI